MQTLTVNNSFEAVKNRHLIRPDLLTLNSRSITNYEAEGGVVVVMGNKDAGYKVEELLRLDVL